jgi:argininosuccinate synthase
LRLNGPTVEIFKDKYMPALILYYDEYHTPVWELASKLTEFGELVLLHIRIDENQFPPEGVSGSPYRLVDIDARDRFCEHFICRAIKANACYQNGYYLSAALSRPLMAEICAEQIRQLRADVLVHGFAGNDSLRFTTGVMTLTSKPRIINVRELCGSRTAANSDQYTVSSNIWGSSVEAGCLGDPSMRPPLDALATFGEPVEFNRNDEIHSIEFEAGTPVGLDGVRSSLCSIVQSLNHIGWRFGIGQTDLVEDGHVGLKTRALYGAPAAASLITAHQELERLTCTRRQNQFKRLVDAEWTDLIYDGYWFDPAREALEAYIEFVNQWVSGTVDLVFMPGGLRVVARGSPFAIYGEEHAVYRAGQDFGENLINDMATLQSLGARIAHSRTRSKFTTDHED